MSCLYYSFGREIGLGVNDTVECLRTQGFISVEDGDFYRLTEAVFALGDNYTDELFEVLLRHKAEVINFSGERNDPQDQD